MAKQCYRITYGFDNYRIKNLGYLYKIQHKGFLSSARWQDCGLWLKDRRKAKKELNRLVNDR